MRQDLMNQDPMMEEEAKMADSPQGLLAQEQDMQAPEQPGQPMLDMPQGQPMDPAMESKEPLGGGAPDKSVSFDVDRNPADKQMMADSVMYAYMLKNMNHEQRKEQWPQIVAKMSEVNPKAEQMFDPTLPPTDEDLKALLGRVPGKKNVTGEVTKMEDASKVPSDFDTYEMSNEELIANSYQVALLDDEDGEEDPRFRGAPKGFMWINPNDRSKGLVDLKRKEKTPEQAAKITMMNTARALLPTIQGTLFTEDGKVNWDNVKKSNIPIIGGSVPWSGEAKRLAQSYEVAIQAVTRGETGAAMPPEEVENTRKRYQCDIWDSEDSCVQKYLSLKMFVNGSLDLLSKPEGGKVKFDTAKADAYDAKLQLETLNYKKDWMKRAMKANPNASTDQLHQLFNKKVLTDKKFLDTMSKQLKKD